MGDCFTEVNGCLRSMALFSEDLFNVFEESEKPSLGKSKKRKRNDQKAVDEDGAKTTEETKKAKVEDDAVGEMKIAVEEPGTSSSLQASSDRKTDVVRSSEAETSSSMETKEESIKDAQLQDAEM